MLTSNTSEHSHNDTDIFGYTILTVLLSTHCFLARFCWGCVDTQRLPTPCPNNHPPCEDAILKTGDFYPDHATEREIKQLRTRCLNPACSWTERFGKLTKHMEMCDHHTSKVVTCVCGAFGSRDEVELHSITNCSYRSVPCSYCNVNVRAGEMFQHVKSCSQNVCPFGCNVIEREHAEKNVFGHCLILIDMMISLQGDIQRAKPQIGLQNLRNRLLKSRHDVSKIIHAMLLYEFGLVVGKTSS